MFPISPSRGLQEDNRLITFSQTKKYRHIYICELHKQNKTKCFVVIFEDPGQCLCAPFSIFQNIPNLFCFLPFLVFGLVIRMSKPGCILYHCKILFQKASHVYSLLLLTQSFPYIFLCLLKHEEALFLILKCRSLTAGRSTILVNFLIHS